MGADLVNVTAIGRVQVCVWCGVPLGRDPWGGWIHVTQAYTCRGQVGWLRHTAQPLNWRRVLPAAGRRCI
jgi:hypothetical protein